MSQHPRHVSRRRNELLCTINGICTQLGMNLAHPSMVLSVFVRALGGSNTLVGLLPALRFGGWFTPQFLVAGWVQGQERKARTVASMEVARVVIYAGLSALTYFLATRHPSLLLVLFFALFTCSRFTAGAGALARMDALGKLLPPAGRSSFFANRNFWAGALVFGAGFLVRSLLDPARGLPFPSNFALLFGLSSVVFALAMFSFARVREPPDAATPDRHSLREQLARAPALLRQDADFRRYLLGRSLLNMTRIADPFYPVFALEVLGAPDSIVGFYLSAMTLASIVSNLLWRRVGRTRGSTFLVRTCSLLAVLTPLLAIVLPWAMRTAGFTVDRYGLLPAYLFSAVFMLAGASNSGRSIGLMALVLDLAPDEQRATYIGLVNTVLGLVSFLPIVSGAIIDRVGFEPIFFGATGLIFAGYLVTLRWKQRETAPH